jgi:hemerythrin-like domain-containing protein
MKTATEILTNEHESILKVVEAMESECHALENEKNLDKDFFTKAIDFIKNYADKFHHAKEEEILFKELKKEDVQGRMHCNPMDQMLHEHDLGREFVKNLEEGIKEEDKEKIIENARGYGQLLREHIFKEDNILYGMADEALNDKEQDFLLKQFKVADKKNEKDEKRCLKICEEFEKKV